MNPLIQIAGIIDLEEAEMLCAAGANCLGLPLRLKDGREDLSEQDARAVIQAVGSSAMTIAIRHLSESIIHLASEVCVLNLKLRKLYLDLGNLFPPCCI